MRIAIVAPPFGQIGGPEVVVNNLTNELFRKGINVTLFAPGDWVSKAPLVPTLSKSLWAMKNFKNQTEEEREKLIIDSQLVVLKYQDQFDIIHLHSQRYAHLVANKTNKPCILTNHNRVFKNEIFESIRNSKLLTVAISEERNKNFQSSVVIENGIPVREIIPSFESGKYLIAVGRLTESKGIHTAIEIAVAAKKKLLIFGRIGNSEERQEYFNQKINPFLNDNIVHMGEASQEKLFSYMRNAEAFLFPIRNTNKMSLAACPLVVMESLACGTPVIGSPVELFPELNNNEKIGCFSENFDDLLGAVKNLAKFDRKICRNFAEERFDSSLMAEKYAAFYRKILDSKKEI